MKVKCFNCMLSKKAPWQDYDENSEDEHYCKDCSVNLDCGNCCTYDGYNLAVYKSDADETFCMLCAGDEIDSSIAALEYDRARLKETEVKKNPFFVHYYS